MEDLLDQEAESRRVYRAANLTSSRTQNGSQDAGGVADVEAWPNSDEKAAADLLFHMDRGGCGLGVASCQSICVTDKHSPPDLVAGFVQRQEPLHSWTLV